MSEKAEKDAKIRQSYFDNIKAKTGKSVEDFRVLVAEKGLTKPGEIVSWLKAEFGLGHGHANAVLMGIRVADERETATAPKDYIAALFTGKKAAWRDAYDTLAAKITAFGADVQITANSTYVNVNRKRKFAILQPSTSERFDVGLKLKGTPPTERLEAAGTWNAMVTHRVRLSDPAQIDDELIGWLKQAYDEA
jgi:predicted transport protein